MQQDSHHIEERLLCPPRCVTVRVIGHSFQQGKEHFIPRCSLKPHQVVRHKYNKEGFCHNLSNRWWWYFSRCISSSPSENILYFVELKPSFESSIKNIVTLLYTKRVYSSNFNILFFLGVSRSECSLLSDSAPPECWRPAAHFLSGPTLQLKSCLGISVCSAELRFDPAGGSPNPYPQNNSHRRESQTGI